MDEERSNLKIVGLNLVAWFHCSNCCSRFSIGLQTFRPGQQQFDQHVGIGKRNETPGHHSDCEGFEGVDEGARPGW